MKKFWNVIDNVMSNIKENLSDFGTRGRIFSWMAGILGTLMLVFLIAICVTFDDNKERIYLGHLISSRHNISVFDETTQSWNTYRHYVVYRSDDGDTHLIANNDMRYPYTIKTDDLTGERVLYKNETKSYALVICSTVTIVLYLIVMILWTIDIKRPKYIPLSEHHGVIMQGDFFIKCIKR